MSELSQKVGTRPRRANRSNKPSPDEDTAATSEMPTSLRIVLFIAGILGVFSVARANVDWDWLSTFL